ncbi:MAG: EscU/YscU/HrcU family type III secretion system export apparatus switch protein [Geminicoccaceae bacterium]
MRPAGVTAKGRGAIAAQILGIAAASGIPIERDPDLVTILAKLDVGSPIPTAAFAAVAEILAHLYRANARAQAASGDAGPEAGRP